MSWAFRICTVIWVCEASKVNNLTVLAVGPNHRDNVLRRLYCFFTEVIPKKRLFRVGTLRVRQQFHSDFLPQKLSETGISVENTCSGWSGTYIYCTEQAWWWCVLAVTFSVRVNPCVCLLSLSLSLRVTLSLSLSSPRRRQWIVCVMGFQNMYSYMGLWSLESE